LYGHEATLLILAAVNPHEFSDLGKVLGILVPVVGLIGGAAGFFFQAPGLRQLVHNILAGAGLGGLVGTAIALALWLGAKLGGA
jgi:hypothetical protein